MPGTERIRFPKDGVRREPKTAMTKRIKRQQEGKRKTFFLFGLWDGYGCRLFVGACRQTELRFVEE